MNYFQFYFWVSKICCIISMDVAIYLFNIINLTQYLIIFKFFSFNASERWQSDGFWHARSTWGKVKKVILHFGYYNRFWLLCNIHRLPAIASDLFCGNNRKYNPIHCSVVENPQFLWNVSCKKWDWTLCEVFLFQIVWPLPTMLYT